MLAVGNGKLGEQIAHFDLPPVSTCPGRSEACERVCYARVGRFRYPSVKNRMTWCEVQSRRKDFVGRMVAEIRSRGILVIRLHVSGDFYDAGYARKWLDIMRLTPRVRHYFYTRSWRVPDIEPVLRQMAGLACCRAWYSCDRDTGLPLVVPDGVRLAWMQDTQDPAPEGVRLVFRTRRMFCRPRVGLPMVCPNDTPAGRRANSNCGSCGECWQE